MQSMQNTTQECKMAQLSAQHFRVCVNRPPTLSKFALHNHHQTSDIKIPAIFRKRCYL